MFFRLSAYLDRQLNESNWLIKIFLYSILASVFLTYLGNFWYINQYFQEFLALIKGGPASHETWQFHWDTQIWKSNHLFIPANFDPKSHEAKIAFRFTIPLLLLLCNQKIWLVYLIQIALGLYAYYMFLKLVSQITQERKITFFFAMGVSTLYFINSLHLELLALGDSFAYSFLILGFYFSKNRYVSGVFLLAALLTDERSLIGCAMGIILKYFMEENQFWDYVKTSLSAISVYLFIRFLIYKKYGLITPAGGIEYAIFLENLNHGLLISYNAFKSYYIFYFFPIAIIVNKKTVLYTLFAIAFILSSFLVWDVTRSISFSFWGLLIGLHFMVQHIKNQSLIYGILIACMVSAMLNVTIIFP
jgi:hypothetical protein